MEQNLHRIKPNDTKLTAMQYAMVQRLQQLIPLIADLTGTPAILCVAAAEREQWLILDCCEPNTTFNPLQTDLKEHLEAHETGLVMKAYQLRSRQSGKLQLNNTESLASVFPYIEDNEVIACMILLTNESEANVTGFSRILDTVDYLLKFGVKAQGLPNRLKPVDGIMLTDKNDRIIYANKIASKIYYDLGVHNLWGLFIQDKQIAGLVDKEVIVPQEPYTKDLVVGNKTLLRRELPVMEAGNLLTRIIILTDVTEMRAKDRELKVKATVIQEIHHRMKNNLQTIASLLRLQARRSDSAEVKAALNDSINRILSIGIVHEFLAQQATGEVAVNGILRQTIELLTTNLTDSTMTISIQISGDELYLPTKHASNLALIINELVMNSLEHGFLGRDTGKIEVKIKCIDKYYRIEYRDDGNGWPPNFTVDTTKSLGLQIIKTLVEGDLNGSLELTGEQGAVTVLEIPYTPKEDG